MRGNKNNTGSHRNRNKGDLRKNRSSSEVAIISASSETLTGLRSYLRAAGVVACGTHVLDELPRLVSSTRVAAFVLFPDDYRWEAVIATISEVAERRRRQQPLLNILVTAHAKRFEELTLGQSVIVVPRPAWSWTILDVIRGAHDDDDDDDDGNNSGEDEGDEPPLQSQ